MFQDARHRARCSLSLASAVTPICCSYNDTLLQANADWKGETVKLAAARAKLTMSKSAASGGSEIQNSASPASPPKDVVDCIANTAFDGKKACHKAGRRKPLGCELSSALRFALLRFALCSALLSAPLCSLLRFARLRFARLRFARLHFARLRFARLRFARLRFALCSALLGSALLGSALLGSALLGSARLGSRLGSPYSVLLCPVLCSASLCSASLCSARLGPALYILCSALSRSLLCCNGCHHRSPSRPQPSLTHTHAHALRVLVCNAAADVQMVSGRGRKRVNWLRL